MILAIDPGASGALAFFSVATGTLDVVDMPVMEILRNGKTKREISPTLLANEIRQRRPSVAVLERVSAMPGQGVSSMFAFGRYLGMAEGAVAALGLPITYVTPRVWQKAVGARGGKDGARLRAVELFPAYAALFARKKDNGRADAALMAFWRAME